MFDKINGPSNPMAGPAQGHSTEQGDSWHTAVGKINAGFKTIIEAIKGGALGNAPDDEALGKRLTEIEDALATLQIKVDALTLPQTAPETARVADVKPPETPPPSQEPIADFSPAKPETAIPVTTASTYIGAGNPAA
jgi:hypothetical protein